MKTKIKALFERARTLPAEDRILVLESMLDTLEYFVPAMEQLWTRETADRMAAFRRGEVVAKEASAIFAKHRSMEAKAMTVRFVEVAETEFDEAMYSHTNTASVMGHYFLDEVMAAADRIARYPMAWRSVGEGVHRCRVGRFAQELLYTADNAGILVLAVADTAHRPLYWRDLLEWRERTKGWPSPIYRR